MLASRRGGSIDVNEFDDEETMQRNLATAFGVLALLLLAGTLVALAHKWLSSETLARLPENGTAEKVVIEAARIPLRDFGVFLKHWTGLEVIIDSRLADRVIEVAVKIDAADGDTVREILVANGYRVSIERLTHGARVVRIK